MTVNINISIPISYTAPLPLPPPGAFVSRNGHGDFEHLFREHAERWKKDTQHCSSVVKMLAHPSYLRIIGLAGLSRDYEIERLLLSELETEPDHWFAALTAITGEDPVGPQDDFDESVAAWIEWGKQKGILASEDDRTRRA